MSLSLRQINKLTHFPHFNSCRTNVIKLDKYKSRLSSHFDQYSTCASLKGIPCTERSKLILHEATDNREAASDTVTKEHVFPLERMTDLCNFSKNLPPLCNKAPGSDNSVFIKDSSDKLNKGPSNDKLMHVHAVLSDNLPKVFVEPMDYTIYHPDLIFEDNIRGVRTVGLYGYVKQVALLRVYGHLKFAYVRFEILKITMHPEDSTVKVRWRIRGLTALKVMMLFWKYKLWNLKEAYDNKVETWYDGFSTFYVNADGKIVKHVADKMMPDTDESTTTTTSSDISAAKLALILGIIPKVSDVNPFT